MDKLIYWAEFRIKKKNPEIFHIPIFLCFLIFLFCSITDRPTDQIITHWELIGKRNIHKKNSVAYLEKEPIKLHCSHSIKD